MSSDLAAVARGIIDSNLYMTLATADETGRPWASPVYYAPDGYADLYWVSGPETTHSRNLAVRPELAIVVFESGVPTGTGQAVYMEATARRVEGQDAERGIEVFSRVLQEQGGDPFTMEEVEPPAHLRLYRASVSQHYVLDPDAQHDERTPVNL
jgi:nitroimidazol reductase NimA-like FMN-containing flavoprotein (pyridoxamine 5'-phosphate oxidase superfamily)